MIRLIKKSSERIENFFKLYVQRYALSDNASAEKKVRFLRRVEGKNFVPRFPGLFFKRIAELRKFESNGKLPIQISTRSIRREF